MAAQSHPIIKSGLTANSPKTDLLKKTSQTEWKLFPLPTR
jgi:hypothetical protein